MEIDRSSLDDTLANMFSHDKYSSNALFYAHLITKCSVKINNDLPAPAGVSFNIDHYMLYINTELFAEYELEDRMFILIHEMLHIINNHVHRLEEREPLPFNFATDCAINQLVPSLKPPEGCILPANFPTQPCPEGSHAEFYYELLKNDPELNPDEDQECQSCGGSGEDEDGETCSRCGGSGKEPGNSYEGSKGKLLDDHGTWQESVGDKDLQQDVTKKMLEDSMNETIKSKGNIPENMSSMLELFTRKSQVNWKRVLKSIVGNKKVGKRPTIMRKPRRFNNRPDLKGKTKDRMFTLVVGVDISGSMSTNEIMQGLSEIHEICKLTKTTMKLIQIDTVIHKIEEFSDKTKLFERSGCGGTYMGSCPEYIMKNRIECDALVMISDMVIEHVPTDTIWGQFKKRVIWLSTDAMPDWNGWNNHKILPLKIER